MAESVKKLLIQLRELQHKNFYLWPVRWQYGILLVLSITLSCVINSLMVSSKQTITMNNLHNAELLAKINTELLVIEQVAQIKKPVSADVELLEKVAPLNLSLLLSRLSLLSKQNNLEIYAIKPLAMQSVDNFNVQPVQIAVHGNYAQLVNFMQQLEQLPFLVLLGDLYLKKPNHTEEGAALTLELTLQVYSHGDKNA